MALFISVTKFGTAFASGLPKYIVMNKRRVIWIIIAAILLGLLVGYLLFPAIMLS